MDNLELNLAVDEIRYHIPTEKSLEERIAFAFRYAREHEPEVFWMSGRVSDDLLMRAGLGAVMVSASEEDREQIEHSLKPLRAINAMLSGVPVDMSAVDMEDVLPIRKLFDDSKRPA